MSDYLLVVTRIEPHPKAGQALPYSERVNHGLGYCSADSTYPDTVNTKVLEVFLTQSEFAAMRRSVLEAGPGDAL